MLEVSGVSAAAGQKKGPVQSEKKLYLHIGRQKSISKHSKKVEWILIFKKQLDRINRIVRIEWPSAEGSLAVGERNPVNPVNPV